MEENSKKRSTGKLVGMGCLGLVALLVILGVIGSISGTSEDKSAVEQKTAASAAPPMVVTAKEISAAFQENEVKAKQDYDKKRLQVTGTIKSIELDFADKPVVKLAGANDQMNMGVNEDGKMTDVHIAGLPETATASLKKGDALTVNCGSVSEVMGSAQLGECSVADAGDRPS